jgi:hypothetical protein
MSFDQKPKPERMAVVRSTNGAATGDNGQDDMQETEATIEAASGAIAMADARPEKSMFFSLSTLLFFLIGCALGGLGVALLPYLGLLNGH